MVLFQNSPMFPEGCGHREAWPLVIFAIGIVTSDMFFRYAVGVYAGAAFGFGRGLPFAQSFEPTVLKLVRAQLRNPYARICKSRRHHPYVYPNKFH